MTRLSFFIVCVYVSVSLYLYIYTCMYVLHTHAHAQQQQYYLKHNPFNWGKQRCTHNHQCTFPNVLWRQGRHRLAWSILFLSFYLHFWFLFKHYLKTYRTNIYTSDRAQKRHILNSALRLCEDSTEEECDLRYPGSWLGGSSLPSQQSGSVPSCHTERRGRKAWLRATAQ